MITLKTADEIAAMRDAGRLLAEAHQLVGREITAGVTTSELDAVVESFLESRQAIAIFKGLSGPVPFPAATCISVNEQLIGGIPGSRALRTGDLISVDIGCRYRGWCADAARTYPVGMIDGECRRLLNCGESVLRAAIDDLVHATTWKQVAAGIEERITTAGFFLMTQFLGHGIGRELHEDPQVPHSLDRQHRQDDFRLEPGLVFTIEPVVALGSASLRSSINPWLFETSDGKPGVHFEETVAITDDGPLVLTSL